VGLAELYKVSKVLRSGNLTQGSVTAEFEEGVARVCNSTYASAVSSATTGLHLALRALGIGSGHEVIIPAFSFPATANVVEQIGAKPIMVDILPQTWCIDPNLVASSITTKTRAIMPVHAFGLMAATKELKEIGALHGIPIIEDAACALGARNETGFAGAVGDIGVFSFHPRKVLTTGEGGMVLTQNEEVFQYMQTLRSHGGQKGEFYLDFIDAGYNYRLSDVASSIGLAQLKRLENLLRRRREVANAYFHELQEIPDLCLPLNTKGEHTYQSFVVKILSVARDDVIRIMKEKGFETTLGTYGMHLQPFYLKKYDLSPSDFPVATEAHRQLLTLPIDLKYGPRQAKLVARALRRTISVLKVSGSKVAS